MDGALNPYAGDSGRVEVFTGEDVEAALRFLHGTPRVYAMFEVDGVGGEPNIPDALDRTAAVVQRRLDLAGIDASAEGFSGETAVIVVQGAVGDLDALIALVTRPGRLEFTDLRNAPVTLEISGGITENPLK